MHGVALLLVWAVDGQVLGSLGGVGQRRALADPFAAGRLTGARYTCNQLDFGELGQFHLRQHSVSIGQFHFQRQLRHGDPFGASGMGGPLLARAKMNTVSSGLTLS